MASRGRRGGNVGYLAKFGLTAALLVAGTLALVLVVLPQRYVLSAGFRESGRMFPDPGVPFAPTDPIRVDALPTPGPTVTPLPGPAELLWSRVLPLIDQGRFAEAAELFETYLEDYPDDLDARRELGVTLVRANRTSEGIPILAEVVGATGDPELRLLLARVLRDVARVPEAAEHYAVLASDSPDDIDLTLEWSRAESWAERYEQAEAVLLAGLERNPDSVPLRAELARLYYFTGRLGEADRILGAMSDEELTESEAIELRAAVTAALAVPEASLVEQAAAAREGGDFDAAKALLERALAEDPGDVEAWVAYANLLEYELSDFEGALEALAEVERRQGSDPALHFRMARLELWTEDRPAARARLERALAEDPDFVDAWLEYANLLEYELSDFEGALEALREVERRSEADAALQLRMARLEMWTEDGAAARARLERLLATLPPGPASVEAGAPGRADVQTMLGDLDRWEGDRVAAARRYREALLDDAEHGGAKAGLTAVRAEVDQIIEEVERPRVGGLTYAVGDTDDYLRFDAGGEWAQVREDWAWTFQAGQRWLAGPTEAPSDGDLDGAFLEVSPSRWFREGTVRASLRAGVETVRDGEVDATFGAGIQLRPQTGGVIRLTYAHEPAYGSTATLQSAAHEVTQDRVVASVDRSFAEVWSVTAQGDWARLSTSGLDEPAVSTRVQVGAAVARRLSDVVSLGWAGSQLGFSEASPAPDGLRLFWDPSSAFATGPLLTMRKPLGSGWEASGRLNPGIARIDEREVEGYETVPQLSADARLEYTGSRLRTTIDLFYTQARVEGYRSFGARVSVGAGRGGRR